MKVITRLFLALLMVLALTGYHKVGFASVVLHNPTWEAPGGYSMTSSGNIIQPGGLTWDYSGFDPTAYAELYYVIGDYIDTINWVFTPEGPKIGTKYRGIARLNYNASASDLSGGKVVWTNPGSMSIAIMTGTGTVNIDARFTLSVFDALNNSLSLIDASTISGMDSRVGGAHPVTGDFKANWLFEFAYQGNSSSWLSAGQFYHNLNTYETDGIISSVTRAFYFEAVPIPAPLWLLLSGLIGIVGFRRKFKS